MRPTVDIELTFVCPPMICFAYKCEIHVTRDFIYIDKDMVAVDTTIFDNIALKMLSRYPF